MNKAIIIGNITQDIELKQSTNGTSYCRFSVADNVYSADGKKVTEFIDCQAWKKDAEIISKYAKKGSKIAIEGCVHTNRYETAEGKKKDTLIVVKKFEFLSGKQDSNNEYTQDVCTDDLESRIREMEGYRYTPKVNTKDIKPDDLPFF